MDATSGIYLLHVAETFLQGYLHVYVCMYVLALDVMTIYAVRASDYAEKCVKLSLKLPLIKTWCIFINFVHGEAYTCTYETRTPPFIETVRHIVVLDPVILNGE